LARVSDSLKHRSLIPQSVVPSNTNGGEPELQELISLKGSVIAIDVMWIQGESASATVTRGGDYFFTDETK
jgi:hypothetical protein